MKKLLMFAGVLLALVCTAQPAIADPGDPIIRGTFDVEVVGKGQVTGTSIDCPGDCSAADSWRESEMPPKNRLTAVENTTGWTFVGWDGCGVVTSNGRLCDAFYSEMGVSLVTATFADTAAPWVALGPLQKPVVSNNIYAGVTASDNDRVVRMQYLIDGAPLVDTATGPWPRDLDISGIAEGQHTIAARAFDPAGNSTTTAAQTFEIERVPPVIRFNSPVAATNAASPSFSFTPVSDDFESASCNIIEKGTAGPLFGCEPDEPWSKEVPTEGDWQFWVSANDHAGNIQEFVHDFVVDRTAPEVTITSGPADGDTVEKGDLKYGWTVNDRTAVSQKCSWDGGQKSDCDLSVEKSLLKGEHVFELEVTDQAGNVTSTSRRVNVLADGKPANPGPTPNPKPGPKPGGDTTAPVVKLSVAKQKLRSLKKGLKVKVRCNEACSGKVIAKAARGVKFTGRAKLTSAGTKVVLLKPNSKAKKALKASPKALKLTLSSTVSDTAGNKSVARSKTRVRK